MDSRETKKLKNGLRAETPSIIQTAQLQGLVNKLFQKCQQINSEICKELVLHDKKQVLQNLQRENDVSLFQSFQTRSPSHFLKLLRKWEIINNVVQGIYKSLSIIQVEKCHVLNEVDFKMHNKISMQSVFRSAFKRCKFKDFSPFVFENIRRIFGISNESFLKSIGLNTFQTAFVNRLILLLSENSPGKSGSFFFVTSDNKFLIKTIKEQEFELLKDSLKEYYQFLDKNRNSLLCRYYGMYQIICYQNDLDVVQNIYIVVMNNIFQNTLP